jgi:hypothetical protein
MNRTRIILLFISIVAIGTLLYFTLRVTGNSGKSVTELIEFSIEDTSTVDRIIITDGFSRKMELVRSENGWTDENGGCVTQENVNFILEAFKKIEFKGYISDNSKETFTNMMSAQHTKVEIYQDGDWVKSWYIGPASQDHYGQIMLLETADEGKSSFPVMMKINGVNGIIEPRFFADKRKWICTRIFALNIDQIAKVDVKFNEEPKRSFTVTKNKSKLDVYQQGKKLPQVDTAMIFRYLQKFKKIHFELANFELNDRQIDSMKRTRPFAVMTVKETSGKTTKLRMFRIQSDFEQRNEFGEIVDIDMNKFWCELPDGQLVKCQYFVFNEILLGHVYFPMDLEGIRTE